MAECALSEYLTVVEGGLRLRVRLTPKSSRDAIDGAGTTADGPALKARVRAVPEDGRANAALEKLIAGWLSVARSSVVVVSGHTARVKTLTITGNGTLLAQYIAKRIDALEAGNGGRL